MPTVTKVEIYKLVDSSSGCCLSDRHPGTSSRTYGISFLRSTSGR